MEQPFHHTSSFRFRRFLNWFPLGFSYALLYMGRYNLTVCKNELGPLMSKESFGWIFGVGAIVYGLAFLLNGPITDKIGGKRAILIAMFGSALMNLLMGGYIRSVVMNTANRPTEETLTWIMALLYGANMFFQSYGAVAIVKVNAHWFHVKERGGFSGIFGTMISSGIFLAFTVNGWILSMTLGWGPQHGKAAWWVFFAPAALLAVMFVVELFVLKDQPSHAGFQDFDTGDASSGESDDVRLSTIIKRVLTNPIILTVALIEFCTGVLRNGVMHWFPIYAKEVWVLPSNHFIRRGDWGNWLYTVLPYFALSAAFGVFAFYRKKAGKSITLATISSALLFLVPFLQGGWGGILMVAGVAGGNIAGWVSDLIFGSRRAPVAAILYAGLVIASLFMLFTMGGDSNKVARLSGSEVARLYRIKPAAGKRYTQEQQKQALATYPLRVGDVIVAVGSQGDKQTGQVWKQTANWFAVSHAVACLPVRCKDGAKFDTMKCLCAKRLNKKHAVVVANTPQFIPLQVQREGKSLTLFLPDHGAVLRAGEKRVLLAAPQLEVNPFWLCLVVFLMSLAVIGTHGLLSGTATMDFGGRKGAATAVGMIDGFVYLGTGLQSVALGYLTSKNWMYWPIFLLPFGLIGFLLLLRIWHAIPSGRKGGGH